MSHLFPLGICCGAVWIHSPFLLPFLCLPGFWHFAFGSSSRFYVLGYGDHSSCLDVDRFGTFRHLFKHLMRISRGIHPTFAHSSNLRTNECLCFLESVVLVTCDVKFSRHSIWRYQIMRFYAYIALAHCVP